MTTFTCRMTVRFRDLDALGHVNYAVYLTYIEEGFTVLWREVLGRLGTKFSPLEFGCVVVRTEVDYLRSAQFGEELEVKAWVESVGSSSLTAAYEISRPTQKIAEARTVQVVKVMDTTASHMPSDLKSVLRALCGATCD